MINGVDVSDPTRAFMEEQWEQLVWNGGHQYVTQACERINGCGGCSSHGGHDGRGGGHLIGSGNNASSTESDRNGEQLDASTGQQQQSGNGDHASGGWKRLQPWKPYGLPIFLVVQESIHGHYNELVLPHFADCCIACWLAVQFLIAVRCHWFILLLNFILQAQCWL
jgi:hypothetical protein